MSNPLRGLHEQGEAEFQAYGAVEVVSTFGEAQAEYAAIRKGCAVMDLPQRGILELSGPDRLAFLNNLITNEIWNKGRKSGLAAGAGVYAFFLNNKGRIVADLNVLERGDRTLLEMDGRMVESVGAALGKYLFSEKVTITSRVGELHQIALHGPKAGEMLERAGFGALVADTGETPVPQGTLAVARASCPCEELPPLGSVAGRVFDVDVVVWRDDSAGVPGYYLIAPVDVAGKVWMNLLALAFSGEPVGKRAVRPVGWAAYNTARIEAGRAIFGIDFDESVLPGETGQVERAVSFKKGCYLGQEIVARMQSRGQLARQLVGIRMESDALPVAGVKIEDEQGNEIGGVTSSTPSPLLSGVAICLGYLKKPFFEIGSAVRIAAEGGVRTGTVVKLPFV